MCKDIKDSERTCSTCDYAEGGVCGFDPTVGEIATLHTCKDWTPKTYKFDICAEFDCNREYCINNTEVDCKGMFWYDTCMFHGEHKELNEKEAV